MSDTLTDTKMLNLVQEQGEYLLNAIALIAAGQTDIDIEIPEGIDIMSDMAIAISFLAEDVANRIETQNKLLNELEMRVQERTRELENTVKALEKSQKAYIRDEWEKHLDSQENEFKNIEWLQSNQFRPAVEKTAIERTPTLVPVNGNGSSALTVPINLADDLIGMLGFEGEDLADISNEDLSAIEDIAEQVGLALENQRLFNQTQNALAETQELYQISAKLNEAESTKDILDAIVNALKPIDVDFVTLWSIQGRPKDDGSYMEKEQSWTSDGDFRGYPIGHKAKFEDALFFSQVGESHKFVFASSVLNDPQINFDQDMVLGLNHIGIKSFACLPLIVSSRLIGMFTISWKKQRSFSEGDKSRFTAIGTQIATAVDSLRLLDQTQKALSLTQELYEFSAQLNAAESSADIVQSVVNIMDETGLDSARLWFTESTEHSNRWIQIADSWTRIEEKTPREPGSRFDYFTSPFLTTLLREKKQNALISDISKEPLLEKDQILSDRLESIGLKSTAYLPLLIGNRLVGLFVIGWKKPRSFNSDDVQRFVAIAAQIATAVDSLQLLDQTQKSLAETQDLYQISAQLNAAESTQDIVKAVVNTMTDSGLDSARLWFTQSTDRKNTIIEIIEVWNKESPETPYDTGFQFDYSNSPFFSDLLQKKRDNALIESVVNDPAIKKDKIMMEGAKATGLNSVAYMPLLIGNRLVGLFVLGWKNSRTFNQSDQQRFTAIGAQIATAVDSLQLLDQTKNALLETEGLYELSAKLNAAESVDDLMFAIAESDNKNRIDSARLWNVEEQSGGTFEMEVAGTWDREESVNPSYIGDRFEVLEPSFFSTLLKDSKEVALIESIKTDSRTHKDQAILQSLEPNGLNRLVCLPLFSGNRLIALFGIGWKESKPFERTDKQRYATVAAQIATSVNSLRLLDQTQQALSETQGLYQISARLNAAESTSDIISAIAETITDYDIYETILWRIQPLENDDLRMTMIERWPTIPNLDPNDQFFSYNVSEYPFLKGLLTESREVMFINSFEDDTRTNIDKNYLELMEGVGLKSMIYLPLLTGSQLIGLVTLGWQEANSFTRNDNQRFTAIGAQIATAVDSLRLLDQTQQALNETQALYQISARLNAAESAEGIVQAVVDTIQGREIDGARLWLAHSKGNRQWIIENIHSWFKNQKQDQLPAQTEFDLTNLQYLFKLLIETQEIHLISSLQDDVELAKDPEFKQALRPSGYTSMAFLPLMVGSNLVGLFTLGWNSVQEFTALEHQYYTAIGAQIATSVEGLRLLEDARQRAEQLEKLTEIETALSAAVDEDEILYSVAKEFTTARGGLHYIDSNEFNVPESITSVSVYANNQFTSPDFLNSKGDVKGFLANEIWLNKSNTITHIPNVPNFKGVSENSKEIIENNGATAFCIIPLRSGQRWQGVLSLSWPDEYELSATETFLLENLREPLGAIVARRRSQIVAQQARQESEQLYTASSDLNQAASNLSDIVEVVATMAKPAGIARTLLVFTRTDRNNEPIGLEVSAICSNTQAENKIKIGDRYGRSAHEQIAEFSEAHFIEDIAESTKLTTGTKRLLDQLSAPAAGILPLTAGDQEVGFMFLLTDEPTNFNEQNRRLFNSLTPQIAVAVQNSLFLEEAQSRANREQVLRQISEKVRNTSDVESVMRTAVTEIGRVLGRKTFLYLKNNDDDTSTHIVK